MDVRSLLRFQAQHTFRSSFPLSLRSAAPAMQTRRSTDHAHTRHSLKPLFLSLVFQYIVLDRYSARALVTKQHPLESWTKHTELEGKWFQIWSEENATFSNVLH